MKDRSINPDTTETFQFPARGRHHYGHDMEMSVVRRRRNVHADWRHYGRLSVTAPNGARGTILATADELRDIAAHLGVMADEVDRLS